MPRGVATGGVIASILTSFLLFEPFHALLRPAPFPVHVAVKTLIYLVVVLFALSLGAWAFPAPGEHGIESRNELFSLAVCFVFTFIFEINTLLGQNVLLNFVTGRYHRPRLETRVFLFIDMEGSTRFAERLGALAFHRLVNRFVVDLTDPIVAARGEIHSYVGDELIATWKLEKGIAEARCVTACFATMDRLARLRARIRRRIRRRRELPRRLALRSGSDWRDGIGEEGDRLPRRHRRTTARIQEMCRQTGDRAASADLIDQLTNCRPGVAKRR